MRLVEAIESDHREAAALFDELAPLAGDDRRGHDAMRVARRLAVAVKTQALAEEKVLFAALRSASDHLAAYAREQPYAYHAFDAVFDRVLVLQPGPELAAVVAVAKRLHDSMWERETLLLPAIDAELPAAEAAALARDFDLEKQRIRPRVERQLAL